MPWYAWLIVLYYVVDRVGTVAMVGRQIDITPAFAVASLFTGGLLVWGTVALVQS
jgi:hypothetical protein